jgi:choline dehydrogenase-like flavoprotein
VLIDARSVPKDKILEADVCIVGGGAAGITLAREFIGQSFQVCLLESGGLELDQETQALYGGESVGVPYFPLQVPRLRFFGGTTNHWAGFCRPLDEIDFQTRDWIPYSGWPFDKSHLDPFYERAQPICQLGPCSYDIASWEDPPKHPRLPFASDKVITTVFQHSPPTRFGKVYRQEVTKADNVKVYLNANVVNIETTRPAHRVTRLRVACLEGSSFWVTARIFIIAAGGIENARLLLLSDNVQSSGLGNQNDLVGRFFMDHLVLFEGQLLPANPHIDFDLYLRHDHPLHRVPITPALTLSRETLRQERLLNFSAFLRPTWRKGVETLSGLISGLREKKWDDFTKHLSKVIPEIDGVAVAALGRLFKGRYPVELLTLENETEQAPNPTSRITLDTKRDRLGKNRVRLDWRLSAIDKRTIWRAHEIIGQELGRAGIGRLRVTLDHEEGTVTPSLAGGFHHMGTTRMHTNPKLGVVNENCRVHEISNLFIAGSSVFPTSGHATPTITIVALALRLADHVKEILR